MSTLEQLRADAALLVYVIKLKEGLLLLKSIATAIIEAPVVNPVAAQQAAVDKYVAHMNWIATHCQYENGRPYVNAA